MTTLSPLYEGKQPQLPILLFLACFPTVSALLITPSLPNMVQNLGVTAGQAQLTMTTFLLGYALGNLPYGPLSKRYGRKPIIYLGVLLAAIASLAMPLSSSSFSLLIFERFLMGLGSSVGLKMTFTIIGDVYKHAQAAKKISLLMNAFAAAPAFGIVMGGFLTTRFGWQGCYYFLAAYALFILLLSSFLPETSPGKDLQALNLHKIKEGYLKKLSDPKIVTCAFLMGLGTSLCYLFASEAPFIGISTLGLSPDTYGLLNFIPPCGIIAGSWICHRYAEKVGGFILMKAGIVLVLITGALMLSLFLLGMVTPLTLFLPAPFIYMGFAMVFSNASAVGMSHAQDKSNASAIMHFINIGSAAASLVIMGAIPDYDPWIMPSLFIAIGLTMLRLRAKLKL